MRPLHILAIVLLTSSVAHAQGLAVSRSAWIEGKNELGVNVGFQGGLGGTTPGGAKFFIDYARQVHKLVWLNFQVNPTFSATGTCVDRFGVTYNCNLIGGNGSAVDVIAGVKLKFAHLSKPIVPYVHMGLGAVAIFARPLLDNGVAAVTRFGGGFRWFPNRHVGIGADMGFTLGEGFYFDSCNGCRDGHNEFYRAIDMGLGAEFDF